MNQTTAFSGSDLAYDVLLRGGGMARVRLVQPSDEAALLALNARVSVRTRQRRFFTVSERPGEWYVEQVLHGAPSHNALVALIGGQIVALASFSRLESDASVAELAVLVDDEHQTAGLGTLLLEHLAHVARSQQVYAFHADVLADNTPMLHLLRDSGFVTTASVLHGITELRVDLSDSAALWDAVHRRESLAERASLEPVLAPRRVAVVGSSRIGSVAGQVVSALTTGLGGGGAFTGTVHRVSSGESVAGLDEPMDLVVVAVPAEAVVGVARDAAAAGAKGLLVLSAGFAESGGAGRDSQATLLRICRDAGMRLLGPNCLGVVNTDPTIRLNATFCDADPRAGGVALISQSGAVGIAALRHAERRGAGLSLFVSTGNKADVSGNDLLAYVEHDPRTRVIAMYLESFGNARKFARVAATVGRSKPVVVVKAGRSAAGAKAGLSHTAAAATPDTAIEALLRQAGVLRADDLPELFDVLAVLEGTALPQGARVAIIGNSGGPGVLAADACEAAGLQVGDLHPDTTEQLRSLLPAGASPSNPVDLLATVSPDVFETSIALVLRDPGVDAVVAIYTPLVRGAEELFADALTRARRQTPTRPLLAAFPGVARAPLGLDLDPDGRTVPFFEFPEPAIRALAKVVSYAAWRQAPAEHPVPPTEPVARAAARRLLSDVPVGSDGWLSAQACVDLLALYGIATAPFQEVANADEAAHAADALGYPVVLKAVGASLLHKSDVGGVMLNLESPEKVRAAYAGMKARIGAAMTSAVIQTLLPSADSMELIAGVTVDPSVGPLVLVGAGGVLTDLLDDRVVRMPPVSIEAALAQLRTLRCAPRFDGFRGSPALDIIGSAEVLVALAALTRDLPEVLELDLNPLLVTPSSAVALDVRIRTGEPGLDLPTRALNGAVEQPG